MDQDYIAVTQFENYRSLSEAAASFIGEAILKNSNLLICAATGNSPRLAYDLVAKNHKQEKSSQSVRLIGLDEWEGKGYNDKISCAYQLQSQLIQPMGITDYCLFDGKNSVDLEIDKSKSYLKTNGPIDLCILGIGANGHLGFNEPADYLKSNVHKASLSKTSQNHPMILDSKVKPNYGITLGLADILKSKEILLLVCGENKKAVMRDFLLKNITTGLPASFLWLHANFHCFCEKDAMPDPD